MVELQNELIKAKNALAHEAMHDPLTGALNRRAILTILEKELIGSERRQSGLSIGLLDIDHFKNINDTYGHTTGDCLLKALTHTAEDTIRNSDQVFRYGGEEFVVLLPETNIKGVKNLAERIRRNVESLECICKGHHIKMTASFGVSILNDKETEESFFIRTDKALYEAKNDGRNCTRISK